MTDLAIVLPGWSLTNLRWVDFPALIPSFLIYMVAKIAHSGVPFKSCTTGYTKTISEESGSSGLPAFGPAPADRPLMTPEFQLWFGNSRAVDRWGEPLLVYHGTPEKFARFEYGDIGFHFGTKRQANTRLKKQGGDGYLMTAHLSIQNPLRMRDVGVWHKWQAVALELLNSDIITSAEYERAWNARDEFAELRAILQEKGHDGIVYSNDVEGRGDSWIAFCPDQIMLVDAHRKRSR